VLLLLMVVKETVWMRMLREAAVQLSLRPRLYSVYAADPPTSTHRRSANLLTSERVD